MTSVSPSRVRLGMVGGGEGALIGNVHRMAAALDGSYELVCGSFSRSDANNQRTAAACGVPPDRIHADWEALIEDERLRPSHERMEVLVIVTPSHLHMPTAEAALTAGFHVMFEKPAALSPDEVR